MLRALVTVLVALGLAAPASAQRVQRVARSPNKAKVAATKKARPQPRTRRKSSLERHQALQQAAQRQRLQSGPDIKPRGLAPKNRGELSTLKGLDVGRRMSVLDPTTGHVDHNAIIVETGIDPWSKTPYAWVQFTNYGQVRFAAELLQLGGKPLGVQKRYLQTQRQKLFAALEKHLGVSMEGSKLRTMKGRNWGPRNRKRVHGPRLGPFLSALGQPIGPNEGLVGFERNRTATISRHYAAFDHATTAHELIHTVSEPFAEHAANRGMVGMMEGFTDLFTFRVVTPFYGSEANPNHPYYDFVRFAEHVTKRIGEDNAKKAFFSKDKRGAGLKDMARRYDQAVGKRGAFYKRARALERGDLVFEASGDVRIAGGS